jgi:SAM-dependent methyltransferase
MKLMNTDRWQEAQHAEREHEAHGSGFTPKTEARTYFSKYWNARIESLCGKRVLSVGSGTGAIHSLGMATEAVALDPLNDSIASELAGSTATLITGAGETIPFQSGEFDAVISFNVLDHTVSPRAVLSQINDVLAPLGRLYLAVNTFTVPRPIRRRLHHIDTPHPHHFGPEELRDLVVEAGFSVEHFDTHPRFTDESLTDVFGDASLKHVLSRSLLGIGFTTMTATPEAK